MDDFTKGIWPTRWSTPFGAEMTDEDVQKLFWTPEIAAIRRANFPSHAPLEELLKKDTRIVRYRPGDIVIREGDYGNSAFLILKGRLRVVIAPGLPSEMLGRQKIHKKTFLQSLSQLWTNRKIPEVRSTKDQINEYHVRPGGDAANSNIFLQDIPAVLDSNKTALLGEGTLFGELAALGRIPRSATIFAETEAECLEIRWQGLRELRKYDEGWRRKIDQHYRNNALDFHLRKTSIFSHLDDKALQDLAAQTLFESFGTFDWNLSYQKLRSMGTQGVQHEPVIARQGDYPNEFLMVRAGFARISYRREDTDHTLTYIGAGNFYGADELYRAWKGEKDVSFRVSITALGYVDILRIPAKYLGKYVFPYWENVRNVRRKKNGLKKKYRRLSDLIDQITFDTKLLEWTVQERFINGTQAMLINLERCVRCDDCVNACASTHGGNPRFIRQGQSFDHWMVANACMHCTDPICMIGCPTGAIHRTLKGGTVVINEDTCIGCEICANSCPYSNIRMVKIKNEQGQFVINPETQKPTLKATKCDLCVDQLSGPACVSACSQGALQRVDFRDFRPSDTINH